MWKNGLLYYLLPNETTATTANFEDQGKHKMAMDIMLTMDEHDKVQCNVM